MLDYGYSLTPPHLGFGGASKILSSKLNSFSYGRPELFLRVSYKPSTPVCRYAARQRLPTEQTRCTPINSTFRLASSKISLWNLPLSFSLMK